MINNKTRRFLQKTIAALPKLHRDRLIELSTLLLNEKYLLLDIYEKLPIAIVIYQDKKIIYSNRLFNIFMHEIPNLILDNKKTGILYTYDIFKKERLLDIFHFEQDDFSIFYIDDIYTKYGKVSDMQTKNELKSLEKLAAGISHEIKNPLTAIDIHTQYLQYKLQKKEINISQEVVNYIDIVQKESNRLLSILDTFLNMTRKTNPSFSFIEIEDIIKNVQNIFSEELSIKKIALEIKCDIIPKIFTSSVLIQQAISDLLRNAIEAVENKKLKKIYIHLNEDVFKKFIVVSIGDSGDGIDKNICYNIFDPYFTTKQDGIGLGLTFVKKMIAEIGGSVSLADSIYKGAEFQIYLPITQGQKNLSYSKN